MIDVRLLRNDPEMVRNLMARRHKPELLTQLDEAHRLDARLRDITSERDATRAQVNDISKQVGALRKAGDTAAAEAAMAQSRSLGDTEQSLAAEYDTVNASLRDVLLRLPNVVHSDVVEGAGDAENPVIKGPINMPASFGEHHRVPHWETATALGILDNERAVKISGAMFTMQRGAGATMARALCQYALDHNADAFEEIRPPSLVTSATLTATGQLPKFAEDAYAIERDDLWCIPTAESSLTSIHAGEVLDEAQLPVRYMAHTSCYRREAGPGPRPHAGDGPQSRQGLITRLSRKEVQTISDAGCLDQGRGSARVDAKCSQRPRCGTREPVGIRWRVQPLVTVHGLAERRHEPPPLSRRVRTPNALLHDEPRQVVPHRAGRAHAVTVHARPEASDHALRLER